MANQTGDKLYNLMPAVYRERDALEGEPLRALLAIIEQQADILDADIRRLWDNFFIELCDPWVIPYIGDLVGTVPLFDESRVKQPDTARALFDDLIGPRLIPESAKSGVKPGNRFVMASFTQSAGVPATLKTGTPARSSGSVTASASSGV